MGPRAACHALVTIEDDETQTYDALTVDTDDDSLGTAVHARVSGEQYGRGDWRTGLIIVQ